MHTDLRDLPNLGSVTVRQLQQVGITTADELRQAGTREAFARIQNDIDPGACLHLLYGLEGAVRGISKSNLDADVRRDLLDWYRAGSSSSSGN